jgi:hypothetical protein
MPARTQPNSRFVVAFWRDGEIHDSRTAATGEQALYVALRMLSALETLESGDRLTVTEA